MKMSHYKLGLRNKKLAEQFTICGFTVDRIAALPPEKRQYVRLPQVLDARTAAEASDAEVHQLRMQLKAALTRRNDDFKKYRTEVEYAAVGASLDAASEAELIEAGLDLAAPKTPIGPAGAPTHLRTVPVRVGDSAGAVNLRWKRPVRRCIFKLEYTTDLAGQTGWQTECGSVPARQVIRGLQPGQRYLIRVAAENAAGLGPWSYIQARAGY